MKPTRDTMLAYFRERAGTAIRFSRLLEEMRIGGKDKNEAQRVLRALRSEGAIVLLPNKRYVLATAPRPVARAKQDGSGDPANLFVGRLTVHARGFGFIRRETGEDEPEEHLPDVYIAGDGMSDALHGDLVLARLVAGSDPKRPEGRVVSVLQRGLKHVVGRFHRLGRRGGFVVPRNQRLGRNVLIVNPLPPDELTDAMWVLTRLTEYPPPPDDLVGEIVEVLGDDQTPGIDILLVLRDYGLSEAFPEAVEREVEALPSQLSDADLAGRRDLRDQTCFTIDGYDAKDYDDALAIERLTGGGFRLFVHIADVAHYVQAETALDTEALRRATSVYPVDRVVPMLPERLSNDLCSLKPNEDRLTMTVAMEINSVGKTVSAHIYESAIRSRLRLNYRDVQAFFDGIENPSTRRLEKIRKDLEHLLELMGLLRSRRLKRGALDLDLPEVEIAFDELGAVENVTRAPRWQSHQIVEECMILANEAVSEFMTRKKMPILYRIHEAPSLDSLERLGPVLKSCGIRLASSRSQDPARLLQNALKAVAGHGAAPIFNRLILRSLARACYSERNAGHFGLASKWYSHFTSPIRRYPDLLLHRAVKRVLSGAPDDPDWRHHWSEALPALGAYCSDCERSADAMEEEATRICALIFMRGRLGESFLGFVSNVTSYGMYIELRKYPVSGLLHVRDLHDDRYEYDEERLRLKGRRSGRVYQIGQSVEVLVSRVDVMNQEMDFRLALLEETHPRRGGRLYQSRRRRSW